MLNVKYIKYTWEHKKSFLDVEKTILGHNTIRGYLHDVDKLVMYLFIPKKIVSKFHRKFSNHHINKAKTRDDFIEMLIDWECARYTKKDKPLNAYETLYKLYPHLEGKMLPLMKEFYLVH